MQCLCSSLFRKARRAFFFRFEGLIKGIVRFLHLPFLAVGDRGEAGTCRITHDVIRVAHHLCWLQCPVLFVSCTYSSWQLEIAGKQGRFEFGMMCFGSFIILAGLMSGVCDHVMRFSGGLDVLFPQCVS